MSVRERTRRPLVTMASGASVRVVRGVAVARDVGKSGNVRVMECGKAHQIHGEGSASPDCSPRPSFDEEPRDK
jgi:hypothetical protein